LAYEEMRDEMLSNVLYGRRSSKLIGGLAIVMNKGLATWANTLSAFCPENKPTSARIFTSQDLMFRTNTSKDIQDTAAVIADLTLRFIQGGANHVSGSL
jgi:hypothetical protein